MNKGALDKQHGFSIIEILVVIAIIGILAVIAIPNFRHARNVAEDRSAETYASAIYKIAFAHISENLASSVQTDPDCSDGYTAGDYSANDPGGTVVSCSVSVAADGTPIVTVESINGNVTTLSN